VALLSYVLEIFGEHSLSNADMAGMFIVSAALLYLYWRHSTAQRFPLLDLQLLRVRTARVAIVGGFVTRIAVAGVPFLLPMLYQAGLGRSPLESGLLILPQSIAAMLLRAVMPTLLKRFGHRRILLTNTLAIGVVIAAFATVGPGTPTWLIVCQAFAFGFCASFQYTSMNSLTYADVPDADASKASTLASTAQQMSMSFGVAAASLAAALFVPHGQGWSAEALVRGIHHAFIALSAFTVVSALVFVGLQDGDGASVSRHEIEVPEG
jgi:Na+/melibiose symporter-like transporter